MLAKAPQASLFQVRLHKESRIEEKILAYLTAHPTARDTLEGIVEWWLVKQDIVRAKSDVEAALDRLEARRLVTKTVGLDGRTLYGPPSGRPAGRKQRF